MENEKVTEVRSTIVGDGFTLYKKCNCTGTLTEKYLLKNTQWKIYVLPNRRTFFIINNGIAKIGKTVDRFNEIYNQYKAEIFQMV